MSDTQAMPNAVPNGSTAVSNEQQAPANGNTYQGFGPVSGNSQGPPLTSTDKATAKGELSKEPGQPSYLQNNGYQQAPPGGKPQQTGSGAKAPGASTGSPEVTQSVPGSIPTGKRKILRKKQPVKKNYTKLLWVLGHITTFMFGTLFFGIYFLNFRNRRGFYSRIAYRTSLLGAVMAYTMSIVSKFGAGVPNIGALITTENFQYLFLVVVWFFTRSSVFKILPCVLISFLQLSKYYNLLHKYPKGFTKHLAMVISYNELGLILVLLTNTLLFRGTSGFALVIFLLFYWLRIVYSESTKVFFRDFTETLDERVVSKLPKSIQDEYHKFLRNAELRSNEVDTIFAKIHETNKRTEATAKGEVGTAKEEDKPEDRAFATGPKNDKPVDVNISAGEKEPEPKK